MKDLTDRKSIIKKNFSGAVSYYDEHAGLQKNVARRLANALEPWRFSIVDGPIHEIGAGTGFFTNYLLEMYGGREIIISDLSEEMVQSCKDKFDRNHNIQFYSFDAELAEWPDSTNALVTANYVAQWFKQPAQTLSKIAGSLKPGGLMLVSFPASESFSNWRKYCLDLGLPFTGNSLPNLERVVIELSMGPFKVDYYEDDIIDTFESVFHFFKHLKHSGTSTAISAKQLTPKQLRLLNDYWLEQNNGKVDVQYHTAFIAVKRDPEL